MTSTTRNYIWTSIIVALALGLVLALSACADRQRELPVTELPTLPPSATMPCETLTDAEIIACLRGDDTREICRKLDTTCARYKNLQSFTKRTWAARDGK